MTVEKNQRKHRVNWLFVFMLLLGLAVINCGAAYLFSTPPQENVLVTFWPILFYDQYLPLSFVLPIICIVVIVGLLLKRKNWAAAGTVFLFSLVVVFISLGFVLFRPTFSLIDTLQVNGETYYLGSVNDVEGWQYIAFCEGNKSRARCDYFYTLDSPEALPALAIGPETSRIIVQLDEQEIYSYTGGFPGRCTVPPGPFSSPGSCGSSFHGGDSER